jgi:hypothetical protein
MAPVSGQVLIDGQPVAGLRVTFAPIGSPTNQYPGPASAGVTDENGRYTLLSVKDRRGGAVVGPCRVRVNVQPAGADPNADPTTAAQARRLPARYNDATELKFDVPADGTTEANFSLNWK